MAGDLSYYDVKVYVGNKMYKPSGNYALHLQCTKAGGWTLWYVWMGKEREIGGEYGIGPFCIEVGDMVILGKKPEVIEEPEPIGGWIGVVNNP